MATTRALRGLGAGALAGTAGTTALYAVTYLDQATRGRPSSTLPDQTAARIAALAGADLGEGEKAEARAQGLGGLLGIATGIAVGAAYGAACGAAARQAPVPVAAAGLGAAASLAGLLPMTALRLTDPRAWGVSGWLSDLAPHLVFGLVTAVTFRMVGGAGRRRRR
ncbi:hypothetical protein [Sphaerisporangium sp. TRM90804]|uniref:hypothetical protein n=1 Tax=Sphaerisporangium sp. TRM90804 TaxID=3031113 RepID=UPI002449A988|nr:hypothetical protein [Sphaerisporangium sp. TRM90804]MDH2425461.1 hypothetical protein [Sphaerisporangium sp. TRM90804]